MESIQNTLQPSAWVKNYGNILYQYAFSRVDDSEEAADLVQETLLAGLNGSKNYKGEASEKNWLFSILKNKIIDHYRAKAKKRSVQALPEINDDHDDHWFDGNGGWQLNGKPQQWDYAGTMTERKELQNIIDRCREDLKELQRQVFVLKYMEDRDADFICKVLNISTSNYWVLLHRCRLQMRTCVEHHWLKN
jgi:RNA polymerase sigma-70 factor (TIGR02943 family)